MDKKAESISAGVAVVSAESYRALVEGLLLQRMRADNLQRKNAELIGEADKFRKELRDTLEELDKTAKNVRESDKVVLWWMEKCEKAEQERDALLATLDLRKENTGGGGKPKAT